MQYPISITKDLRRNPYKGFYIAFEGIDGSGKSTQVEAVRKYLEDQNKTVVITSEPMTTGPIQEVIRAALFSKIKITSRAYQDLYSADRAVNHETIIEPALKKGDVVLTHRSFWTNAPYGVLDLGEGYSFEKQAGPIFVAQGMLSAYHQFIAPDITFYLKVSAKKAVERLQEMDKKKDIYERSEKLIKIVSGYDAVAAQFSQEILVIDGEQKEEDITREILQHIQQFKKRS